MEEEEEEKEKEEDEVRHIAQEQYNEQTDKDNE